MYDETQRHVIALVNSVQRNYKPPTVRAWLFQFVWHGQPHIMAMIAVRMAGEGWLRRRRKIEARLKSLGDVRVTTLLDGEYVKFMIEV